MEQSANPIYESSNIQGVQLPRYIVEQIEGERLRLAQELHDGPIQDLFFVYFQLIEWIQEFDQTDTLKLKAGEVNKINQTVHRVIDQLRLISGELRPPTLMPFGLEKAIRSHVQTVFHADPNVTLHLDLMTDGQRLPENVRLDLFRIYQHAVSNVLQHAQAREIWIQFHFNQQEAILEITDNGIGFTPPAKWDDLVQIGHFGLAGTVQRAHSIGGRCEIQSQPGRGTKIHVSVPIKQVEEQHGTNPTGPIGE
jgi:signal transduction histidine kinase